MKNNRQKAHEIYQREVEKRMAPPLNMSRTQAEMLVAAMMWAPQQTYKINLSVGDN